ncbi:MAG: hypothetical protein ACRDFC_07720 [Ignavibacteria bacterium]
MPLFLVYLLVKYIDAKKIADELIEVMKPFCKRIEIAGSLRRLKEEVKDIEICLVPSDSNKLFNSLGFYLIKHNHNFKYIKNGDKYKQFKHRECQVDLFIAKEDNWGLTYLIRTGSAEFSTKVLASWKRVSKGGYSKDGYLYNNKDEIIFTPDEMDVFKLCKMEFIPPDIIN